MAFADQTIRNLAQQLAEKTPTPGGGTAAAIAGQLGAALGLMAIEFTIGRKTTDEDLRAVLASIRQSLGILGSDLADLADADAESYEKVRAARKLPKASEEEKAARRDALQTAVRGAAEVPLRTATLCRDGLEMLDGVAARLNPNLATDVATGASLLHSGAVGACLNVQVNLLDLEDQDVVREMGQRIDQIRTRSEQLTQQIHDWVQGALS